MRRPTSTNPEDITRFSELARKLRETRGLSLTQIAAQTDLSRSYVNNVERGVSLPQIKKWVSLAQKLCADQSEYCNFREHYLNALGLKVGDIEALPVNLIDLQKLDPASPALPNGIVAAINVRSSRRGHELSLEQFSGDLDEKGIRHQSYFYADKTERLKQEGFETREGLADILISILEKPLPIFLVLTQPGKNYQRAWLNELVGRVLCSVDYFASREALIAIDGPVPKVIEKLGKRLESYGIYVGAQRECLIRIVRRMS